MNNHYTGLWCNGEHEIWGRAGLNQGIFSFADALGTHLLHYSIEENAILLWTE